MTEFPLWPHIDGHVHALTSGFPENFIELMDAIRATQAGLACQGENSVTNLNPAGFVLKARNPGRFFLLAGLEHSGHLFGAKKSLPPEEQLRILLDAGSDGIKLLDSKPTERKRLGLPVDGPYYWEFFRECDKLGVPLLWHVADPEEFYVPQKLPAWAREMGWGYDSSYLSKEALYEEVENVLRRHPTLKIIFPHFYFLSADLDLARRWLRKYPYIHFDLAPGIELYYNLSQNFAQARDFFIEFSGRIIYGTDILGSHSVAEVKARAGIIFRFLSTVDEFRIPPEADFLLGKPEDGNIQGLGLPEDVLRSITQDNFRKIFGNHPREIKKEAARAECLRLAEIESEVNGTRIRETDAFRAARELEKNQ